MNMREQTALIQLIALRASQIYRSQGTKVDSQFIASEIKIVHEEICPLRLKDLLEAEAVHFIHDVMGIHNHLDILDGSLRHFTPRFAL